MTNEELMQARAKEAVTRANRQPGAMHFDVAREALRLAAENWMPTPPTDPVTLRAREIAAQAMTDVVGQYSGTSAAMAREGAFDDLWAHTAIKTALLDTSLTIPTVPGDGLVNVFWRGYAAKPTASTLDCIRAGLEAYNAELHARAAQKREGL